MKCLLKVKSSRGKFTTKRGLGFVVKERDCSEPPEQSKGRDKQSGPLEDSWQKTKRKATQSVIFDSTTFAKGGKNVERRCSCPGKPILGAAFYRMGPE
jgi:hypothetical protein